MPAASSHIDIRDWGLLVLLSMIWGGSYIFTSIAIRDLSPLVIVMARVVVAASALLPIHLMVQGRLPSDRKTWMAIAGLSILNNIIPFTLIVTGRR